MSLKNLIRRAQRALVERHEAPVLPVVEFVLPPNGRDIEPSAPQYGRRLVRNGPPVHLVSDEGVCSVEGCARSHFADRLPGPAETDGPAASGDDQTQEGTDP